jgi:hypothetical protein
VACAKSVLCFVSVILFGLDSPVPIIMGHARSFHGCRGEAFEAIVRLGFSQVRLALAYLKSVEEAPNVKRPAGKRVEHLATASMKLIEYIASHVPHLKWHVSHK